MMPIGINPNPTQGSGRSMPASQGLLSNAQGSTLPMAGLLSNSPMGVSPAMRGLGTAAGTIGGNLMGFGGFNPALMAGGVIANAMMTPTRSIDEIGAYANRNYLQSLQAPQYGNQYTGPGPGGQAGAGLARAIAGAETVNRRGLGQRNDILAQPLQNASDFFGLQRDGGMPVAMQGNRPAAVEYLQQISPGAAPGAIQRLGLTEHTAVGRARNQRGGGGGGR